MRFFIGLPKIAAFLKLPEAKAKELIEGKKLPVKTDPLGRPVLAEIDYIRAKVEVKNP